MPLQFVTIDAPQNRNRLLTPAPAGRESLPSLESPARAGRAQPRRPQGDDDGRDGHAGDGGDGQPRATEAVPQRQRRRGLGSIPGARRKRSGFAGSFYGGGRPAPESRTVLLSRLLPSSRWKHPRGRAGGGHRKCGRPGGRGGYSNCCCCCCRGFVGVGRSSSESRTSLRLLLGRNSEVDRRDDEVPRGWQGRSGRISGA